MTAQRRVIVNGIEEPATRSDLLDRPLLIRREGITAENRRDESDLWMEFEQFHPKIFGAILNGLAAAFCNLPTTQLARALRMADLARWIAAAESALPWHKGRFEAVVVSRVESQRVLTRSVANNAGLGKVPGDSVRKSERTGSWSRACRRSQTRCCVWLSMGARKNAGHSHAQRFV